MSLILDALKKIEQDKRRPDGSQIESISVSRERLGGRQHVLSMAAIAVGSALLTAAAVSFLNNNRHGADATVPVAPAEPLEVKAPPEPRELKTPPTELETPVVVVTKEASVRTRDPVPVPEPEPVPASIEEPSDDATQPIPTRGSRACSVGRFEHQGPSRIL